MVGKYTQEEREVAYERKKIIQRDRANKKKQDEYRQRMLNGDAEIDLCECGKFFTVKLNGHIRPGKTYKKRRCPKCPLKPEFRIISYFRKGENRFKEYKVKNQKSVILSH